MTPEQWIIWGFCLAFLIVTIIAMIAMYGALLMASEADDRADETLAEMTRANVSEAEAAMRQMRGGDGDGMLWS